MVSGEPQETGTEGPPSEAQAAGSGQGWDISETTNGPISPQQATELRRRAEQSWRQQRSHSGAALPADALSTLHESEVHQIELEMQNAELRRAQEELAGSHARYFDLFDLAPVGYLILDARGLIREANLMAARLLGLERSQLAGQPFTHFVSPDDQDLYYLYHRRLADGMQPVRACELRLRPREGSPVLGAGTKHSGPGP